jgi:hypothetical protein
MSDTTRGEELRDKVTEYEQLFELQWNRSVEADALWRAEDPEARANIRPDLGVLLTWLMERANPKADAVKLKATQQVLAERERELLELKGPCSNSDCHLHYAHAGPCDVRALGKLANEQKT